MSPCCYGRKNGGMCVCMSMNLHYCLCGCVKGRVPVLDGVIRNAIDIEPIMDLNEERDSDSLDVADLC